MFSDEFDYRLQCNMIYNHHNREDRYYDSRYYHYHQYHSPHEDDYQTNITTAENR